MTKYACKHSRNGRMWTDHIDPRRPVAFDTNGNIRGVEGGGTLGDLPDEWSRLYRSRRDQHITFTVMSYSTPIAWHDDEHGWIVPSVHYSQTTTVAQGRTRYWLHGLPCISTLDEVPALV